MARSAEKILKSIESHRRELMVRDNSSKAFRRANIVSRSINSLFDEKNVAPEMDIYESPQNLKCKRFMLRVLPSNSTEQSVAGCRPCRLSRFSTHHSPRGSSVDRPQNLTCETRVSLSTLLPMKDDIKIETLKRKVLERLETEESPELKLKVIGALKKDIRAR